ncbi:MAG: peptidase C45 [Planctomycetaceae bacterium]|nr:peptidase C45 [Planctomycetaceae bacterium]
MFDQPRYREITVSGPPRELGRQLGEAARDEVQGFCSVALERVQKTVAISREQAYSIAEQSIPFAEAYSPDSVEELCGVAEAAGVALVDLMLLQVRNQLQPEKDGACTSFALSKAERSSAVVGQNWDNDPILDDFTVVLTRHPEGKPSLLTITQAGLISYIGFNSAGIGACLNTLPAPSRPLGVPHYFQLRDIYEQSTLDDAIECVNRAERAVPANIILSTPQGPADLEVTVDNIHVLREDDGGRVTHTNHCVHPELVPINEDFPELIQSGPRKARIDTLIADSSRPINDLKRALSDHQDHPLSICRHANDHPETGFWQTVFSVIIEPDAQQMHVTRGTPCNHPFEVYKLASK